MSDHSERKISLLFNCLDWRLHPQVENFFQKISGSYDLCITAGSIKGLIDQTSRNYFLNQIKISNELHDCQEVVLAMHMDCGAYGGSKAFESEDAEFNHHKEQLRLAESIVKATFPALPVSLCLIVLKKVENEWQTVIKFIS